MALRQANRHQTKGIPVSSFDTQIHERRIFLFAFNPIDKSYLTSNFNYQKVLIKVLMIQLLCKCKNELGKLSRFP